MHELKQKVKEILKNHSGGNSYVVADMHHYLNAKLFIEAKKIMLYELDLSLTEANIIIEYYTLKMQAKISFIEINLNEVVKANANDPIDSEIYLFIFEQDIYYSQATQLNNHPELFFYAKNSYHEISKASQVFRVEWNF